jgi:hypothetical protein
MPPPLGQIRYLTIHCAATPEGRDLKAESISAWDTAKFGQISYHYVIELDGSVHATLPDTLKGAHVGGANTGNVGVCYVGGVDKAGKPKDTRTPAQSAALRKLVDTYRARIPNLIVRGHRDWPGVAKALPELRRGRLAEWRRGMTAPSPNAGAPISGPPLVLDRRGPGTDPAWPAGRSEHRPGRADHPHRGAAHLADQDHWPQGRARPVAQRRTRLAAGR